MLELGMSEISSDLIRSALCETIEKKLNSKKYTVVLKSAAQAGEGNFIAEMYRVEFSDEDESRNEKKSSSKLILKFAPQNVKRRERFQARSLFLREIYMYNEVLPYFHQFEQSKCLTIEDCFTEYPECYRCIDTVPVESIFLEDLNVREFKIIDRYTEEVSAEHVYLIMKALGKYHAISYALKDQQPEKFEEFASNCTELIFRPEDDIYRGIFNQPKDTLYAALSGKEHVHLLAKVKTFFEKEPYDIGIDTLKEARGSGAVILHGDTWQNNAMFRYDNNGKPIEVSLIDWQVARLSSPIIEIAYFMFLSTTKELRDEHYDNFLKVYYDTLSAHIRRLGSDPEKLFSYEMMQDHFRKYAKYSLVMAMLMLQLMTAEKSNGVNLDEFAAKVNETNNVDIFSVFRSENSRDNLHKRLQGVVDDMVRLGYI